MSGSGFSFGLAASSSSDSAGDTSTVTFSFGSDSATNSGTSSSSSSSGSNSVIDIGNFSFSASDSSASKDTPSVDTSTFSSSSNFGSHTSKSREDYFDNVAPQLPVNKTTAEKLLSACANISEKEFINAGCWITAAISDLTESSSLVDIHQTRNAFNELKSSIISIAQVLDNRQKAPLDTQLELLEGLLNNYGRESKIGGDNKDDKPSEQKRKPTQHQSSSSAVTTDRSTAAFIARTARAASTVAHRRLWAAAENKSATKLNLLQPALNIALEARDEKALLAAAKKAEAIINKELKENRTQLLEDIQSYADTLNDAAQNIGTHDQDYFLLCNVDDHIDEVRSFAQLTNDTEQESYSFRPISPH